MIRIRVVGEEFGPMLEHGAAPFNLMNHTSFLDFFVFSCTMPFALYLTPLPRHHRRAPVDMPLRLVGGGADGVFPVHFRKDAEYGVFKLDREKQNPVDEEWNDTLPVAAIRPSPHQCPGALQI